MSSDQTKSLEKAGLKKDQIKIVVHNLEQCVKGSRNSAQWVNIVVHNLVTIPDYRVNFFKDPRKYIMEANPQPSP